jgi:hypothetical protein
VLSQLNSHFKDEETKEEKNKNKKYIFNGIVNDE